jgi:PKD repeat protein
MSTFNSSASGIRILVLISFLVLQGVYLAAANDPNTPVVVSGENQLKETNGTVTAAGICDVPINFTGLNISIPDGNVAGTINSQIVSGLTGTSLGSTVQLKQVCFTINHTWIGDLFVKLIAPDGTEVVLMNRPGVPSSPFGCSENNVDVCIEGGMGNELENQCSGTPPAISGTWTAVAGDDLDAINATGANPNGTWQLFVSDALVDDTGNLTAWSLIFDTGPVAQWTAPLGLCDNSGNFNLAATVTGTPGGIWTGQGVTGSNFNPAGLSGPVPITYTVSDLATGCSDSSTSYILIESPIVPSFTPNIIANSLTVNFTNTTSCTCIFNWKFGDGNTSSDPNPVHTYAAAGTYNVIFTAINSCGIFDTVIAVTVVSCPNVVTDGGFENGPSSVNWTASSTNFGTPVCSIALCNGTGSGTGPYGSGTYWSWFGGANVFEEGSMSQSMVIPVGTATLLFQLEQKVCDSPSDFLKVAVDADTLFVTDGSSILCGTLGYTLQNVNLDAYADGNLHTIKFFSRTYSLNGGISNFFVDEVVLNACPPVGLNSIASALTFKVFPNPAHSYIEISLDRVSEPNLNVELFDVSGRMIMSHHFEKVLTGQTLKLDVSAISEGLYFLSIHSGSGQPVVSRVVIQ